MSPEQVEALIRRLDALLQLITAFDDLDATCVPLSALINALNTP